MKCFDACCHHFLSNYGRFLHGGTRAQVHHFSGYESAY